MDKYTVVAIAEDSTVSSVNLYHELINWETQLDKQYTIKNMAQSEDTIYIGDDNGVIYALDKRSGDILWKHTIDGAGSTQFNHLFEYRDGYLYFSYDDQVIVSADLPGMAKIWRIIDSPLEQAEISGDTLYRTNTSKTFHSTNLNTGGCKWKHETDVETKHAIQFVPNDRHVFVGTGNQKIQAFNKDSGRISHIYSVPDELGFTSDIVVIGNNIIHHSSHSSRDSISCFGIRDELRLWTKDTTTFHDICSLGDSRIAVTDTSHSIRSYTTTGESNWECEIPNINQDSLSLTGKCRIYGKDTDSIYVHTSKSLVAININTGNVDWVFDIEKHLSSTLIDLFELYGELICIAANKDMHIVNSQNGLEHWSVRRSRQWRKLLNKNIYYLSSI
jgi:outer membrane protein assembly factor BamB